MSCFCTLPVCVRGSSSRKCTRCGTLKFASSFRQLLLHPGRRRLGAGPNDGNLDDLAEHVVRHGKGRALLHAFHAADDLLDLPAKHILPAHIDHVLAPADDVDMAGHVEEDPGPRSGSSRRG